MTHEMKMNWFWLFAVVITLGLLSNGCIDEAAARACATACSQTGVKEVGLNRCTCNPPVTPVKMEYDNCKK